jgi:phosphohistidine phosphatase
MKLYLVRHGEARAGADDAARPLTEWGREQVRRMARHVAALGLQVSEIRHSGKLRARESAEIVAERLAPAQGLLEMQGLNPGDDPAIAKAAIEAMGESVMLVGHLPHLGRLASSLLMGDPGKELIRFAEAACACLSREEGGWLLEWLITPALLPASFRT